MASVTIEALSNELHNNILQHLNQFEWFVLRAAIPRYRRILPPVIIDLPAPATDDDLKKAEYVWNNTITRAKRRLTGRDTTTGGWTTQHILFHELFGADHPGMAMFTLPRLMTHVIQPMAACLLCKRLRRRDRFEDDQLGAKRCDACVPCCIERYHEEASRGTLDGTWAAYKPGTAFICAGKACLICTACKKLRRSPTNLMALAFARCDECWSILVSDRPNLVLPHAVRLHRRS